MSPHRSLITASDKSSHHSSVIVRSHPRLSGEGIGGRFRPMPSLVWIDGNWYDRGAAVVSVFDHGLLYGDGVFEGIRSYGGRVFRLDAHLDRLYGSATAIWLDIPITREVMARMVEEGADRSGIKDHCIR